MSRGLAPVFSVAVAVFMLAILLLPRTARADQSAAHSVPVAVLAFDSDDAEEQAEAITGALRSRIRNSQGWTLVETTQSLGMLTAALRCPAKPVSAECEQRIADHIKTERYIYGYVTKGPKPGHVTAEIHLYQRNKPDSVERETYADNLKDAQDEALRKVAQRALDALGGAAVGTIVVRMNNENGEVVIDGDKRVPLKNGMARVELSPGSHSVEVAVTGQPAQRRNVLVSAGKETLVHVSPPGQEAPKSDKPFPTRKVIGGGLVVGGLVAGTIAIVSAVAYLEAQDKGKELRDSTNPQDRKLPPGKFADDVCGKSFDEREAICKANADANRNSAVGWVTGGVGLALIGAGAYFLLTDDKEKAAMRKTRLVPTVGATGGGVIFSQSF